MPSFDIVSKTDMAEVDNAVQGVARFAGELERLQLGGDREGEEAEQDPSQSGDPDPF